MSSSTSPAMRSSGDWDTSEGDAPSAATRKVVLVDGVAGRANKLREHERQRLAIRLAAAFRSGWASTNHFCASIR
jgi:hypothetical protein